MRETIDAPLPRAQHRLIFAEAVQFGTSNYHVPLAFRIRGPPDIVALTAAITELVHRHPILRTVVGGDAEDSWQPPIGAIVPTRVEEICATEVDMIIFAVLLNAGQSVV